MSLLKASLAEETPLSNVELQDEEGGTFILPFFGKNPGLRSKVVLVGKPGDAPPPVERPGLFSSCASC